MLETKVHQDNTQTNSWSWIGGGGFGGNSAEPSKWKQSQGSSGAAGSTSGSSISNTSLTGHSSNYTENSKPDLRNNNPETNHVNIEKPWKSENTINNKSAKIIFKLLTEKYGLSGEAASGWMANIESKSLFNPYQKQESNGLFNLNSYGLFMVNENNYKASKYYKENSSLEDEIANQIQFFIDNHVLSESSQNFLKENNIKDINLVDNSEFRIAVLILEFTDCTQFE